jgi:hypothetical protein
MNKKVYFSINIYSLPMVIKEEKKVQDYYGLIKTGMDKAKFEMKKMTRIYKK